jgi:hypothetical protein
MPNRCFDQLDWTRSDLFPKHGWSFFALIIDLNRGGLPEVITDNGNAIDPNLNDPDPSASGKILVFKNTGGKLGTFKNVQTLPRPTLCRKRRMASQNGILVEATAQNYGAGTGTRIVRLMRIWIRLISMSILRLNAKNSTDTLD